MNVMIIIIIIIIIRAIIVFNWLVAIFSPFFDYSLPTCHTELRAVNSLQTCDNILMFSKLSFHKISRNFHMIIFLFSERLLWTVHYILVDYLAVQCKSIIEGVLYQILILEKLTGWEILLKLEITGNYSSLPFSLQLDSC